METKQSGYKVWLGLFVLLGLALFIGGIFVIGKQKNMFNPVFRISSHFYNVGGLQVGNKVRFSGINIGTVDQIGFLNDSTVVVEMLIRTEIQKYLKTDCRSSIGSEGIIGDKVVNISQSEGPAKMISVGARLLSSEPIEMEAIMVGIKETADNTRNITKDFAEIAHNINKGKGTLARLIRDPSLAKNLGQTIVNLKKSSKGLDENMEAAKHNFLFRGYYKRKERKARERKEKAEEERKEKLESKK